VSAQTILSGAGSTFVFPIMSKWTAEYHKQHRDVEINYLPIGSGAGIAQTMRGMLDFGATDAPLTDEQVAKSLNQIIHVPVTIGADVPAYNLQSARMELRFTPEILANIFLGKISKWNDPAIVAANPGTSLPDKRITVVHRSDGSGTTYVWADYLSKSVLSGRRKSVREQVSNGPSESKARATKVLRQPSSKPMARSAIWSFHTQQGQDHVWQRTKRSWSIRQGDGGLYFGWRGE